MLPSYLPRPFIDIPAQFPPTDAQLRNLQSLSRPGKKYQWQQHTTTTSKDCVDASPPLPPPDIIQIQFKRGTRRRDNSKKTAPLPPPDTIQIQFKRGTRRRENSKKTVEKAIELYVGEKGLLFWINEFAYALIFIIIGAWILFRLVGPALSL